MQVCVACGDSGDRLRETLQPVDNGDQHVLDTAILQLIHDAQPEFGAFVLLEPEAQNFLGPVGAHAECDVHSFVADQPFIADLHAQGVEENQWVGRLQRPWPARR